MCGFVKSITGDALEKLDVKPIGYQYSHAHLQDSNLIGPGYIHKTYIQVKF